jgi:hypothetical protein
MNVIRESNSGLHAPLSHPQILLQPAVPVFYEYSRKTKIRRGVEKIENAG